ncbi:MAG: hypothetical protein U0805_11875 [Pirellulales bacterium]
MSYDSPLAELPKSLQSMIADAQQAIADWDPEEDSDSDTLQFVRESTLRLSRGEYEERLYWECLAEDLEEAGDWRGALASYERILKLPGLDSIYAAQACSAVALIQRLFGEYEAELASRRLATEKSDDGSRILTRHYIANEAAALQRLGFTRQARRLVHRTLAWRQSEGEIVDYLGIARLLIVSARCDLARKKPASAAESLQAAWAWLEALVQEYAGEHKDLLRSASGIHLAHVWWWHTEANRRRLAGEGDTEIAALEQAIEKARLCFDPDGWRAHWDDLTLMQLLLQMSEAYGRHNRPTEATAFRSEAEEIFKRRRFPEATKLSTAFLKRLP